MIQFREVSIFNDFYDLVENVRLFNDSMREMLDCILGIVVFIGKLGRLGKYNQKLEQWVYLRLLKVGDMRK